MRVAGGQKVGEGLVEFQDLCLEFGYLGGKAGVVGGEFARGIQIVLRRLEPGVRRHDRRELGESLARLAGRGSVVVQGRVRQLLLQAGMFGQDVVDGRRWVVPAMIRSALRFFRE